MARSDEEKQEEPDEEASGRGPSGSDEAGQPVGARRHWAWIALLLVLLAGGLALLLSFEGREEQGPTGPDAAADAPPPTGRGRLGIWVSSEEGSPIAGAEVTLRMRFDSGAPLVREALTDADGNVQLDELPQGEADVFAAAEGRARAHVRAIIVDGEGEARLVLGLGQRMTGRVLNAEGEAISGATIEARGVSDDTQPPWTTITDAEGGFLLEGLMLGPQRIIARAEGYDEIARRIVPRTEGESIRIVLERTGVIAGQITQPDGAAGAGAEVVLVGSGVWPARRAEAGSDGHYRFEGVPEGIYEVRARRGGEIAAPREGLTLDAGETARVDFALTAGLTLRGVVLAAGDVESPIAGARVIVGEEALSFSPRAVTTDDDGAFVFDGLRDLPHRLGVHAPGHVSIAGRMVDPGGESLRLVVEAEAIVSGLVFDALDHAIAGAEIELVGTARDGTPIAITAAAASFQQELLEARAVGPLAVEASGELGVTLGPIPPLPVSAEGMAQPVDGAEAAPPGSFTSDASGRFRLSGVPAGRYQIVGRHPDHAPGISASFVIEAGESRNDVALVLPAGANVDGRVVDGRGYPVAHVRVEMHCEREPFARWALAADDGSFAFRGALETCVFSAYPAGLPAARQTLQIEGGQDVSVELALTDDIVTFYGRVVDEDGFPIAGARVSIRTLRAGAPSRRTTWAGDDGTVEVPGMPSPPWRVEVDQEGYALAVVRRLTEAEGEHTLTLHPAATVVGRVLDGWDESPLAGAQVRLDSGGSARFEAASDETGTFELSRVPAGNYTIVIEAPGLLPHRRELRLEASRTGLSDLDLEDISLLAGGGVEGEVVDALGTLIAGAEIAPGSPPRWEAAVRSDASGAFTLSGLPPGDVSVTARHPGAGTSAPLLTRVRPREQTPGALLRLPDRYDEARAAEGAAERHLGVAITLRDRAGRTRVSAVEPESAAARAGLRVRDVLVSIDGESVRTAGQARGMLRGPVGTEVLIEIRRGGRSETIAVQREAYQR